MIEQRFSPLEYRADTGRVEGVALRYGDTAEHRRRNSAKGSRPGPLAKWTGWTLSPGCNMSGADPIGRTGGGGLELVDSAAELRASLWTLPNTRDGADAAELLRSRILRGWSVEVRATREKVRGRRPAGY